MFIYNFYVTRAAGSQRQFYRLQDSAGNGAAMPQCFLTVS
jgi:hypothetical protein